MGRIWAIALPLLATCVFLWGLEYKLSLYFPPQTQYHQVPIAKLLSKNEQAPTPADAVSEPASRTQRELSDGNLRLAIDFPAFLLLAAAMLVAQASHKLLSHTEPARAQHAFFFTNLFVRPPPQTL